MIYERMKISTFLFRSFVLNKSFQFVAVYYSCGKFNNNIYIDRLHVNLKDVGRSLVNESRVESNQPDSESSEINKGIGKQKHIIFSVAILCDP